MCRNHDYFKRNHSNTLKYMVYHRNIYKGTFISYIKMISVIKDGKKLSCRESERMIKSFWSFCHGDCCRNKSIGYENKEDWFCECHEDFNNFGNCDDITFTMEWF